MSTSLMHVGFLMNIPAKGNKGAKETLRHQPFWWGKFIPTFLAEYVCALTPDSLCYFGPSPLIACNDGIDVVVHIFAIPATSGTLLNSKRRLHRRMVQRLLDSPKKILGLSGEKISVLGLGAATAIAAHHGRGIYKVNQLLERPIPIITNGNTITANLAVDIALLAREKQLLKKNPEVVGVVGGFGSVGSRVVNLVAYWLQPHRINIVGRENGLVNDLALKNLRVSYPKTEFRVARLQDALSCPLVFLATSSVEPLPIDPKWLPFNSVIIDIGKPANTSPQLAAVCKEKVFIADGSLAQLPDGTDWGLLCERMALPKNTVFGCLAETITLACLLAKGELEMHIGKSTFIGRPDGEISEKMMTEVKKAGLRPYFHPLHKI